MKFKTNAKCGGCTSAIISALASVAPASDWQFDLTSPDKTLTYVGSNAIDRNNVVALVEKAGFKVESID